MIPTPDDLRRVERAVREFGFDPRNICGDKFIHFWFATKQDDHFDYDNSYKQDCSEGDLIVMTCGICKMTAPNWVMMINHRNGSMSYIFKPLSKLTKKEERHDGIDCNK